MSDSEEVRQWYFHRGSGFIIPIKAKYIGSSLAGGSSIRRHGTDSHAYMTDRPRPFDIHDCRGAVCGNLDEGPHLPAFAKIGSGGRKSKIGILGVRRPHSALSSF